MRRISVLLGGVLAALTAVSVARAGYTFTTFDDPDGAPGTTHLTGIDGNTLVGTYGLIANGYRGFIYSNGTFTTLRVPSGTSTPILDTEPAGIWGNTVVGNYRPNAGTGIYHGFIYDGTSYTTFDVPGAVETTISGISGSNIIGNYRDGAGNHNFVYDGHSFAQVIGPAGGAGYPIITGIDGNLIVGMYSSGFEHPFTLQGNAYFTPGDPAGAQGTYPTGVSGSSWVGYFDDSLGRHGFIYNNNTYTTFNDPLAVSGSLEGTHPTGVSGTTIVGFYSGADGEHGFIAAVPEPSSAAFLFVATLPLLQRRRL